MGDQRNRPRAEPDPPSPRQRLLDAADALFYGQGIRNTGVDAILEHAQVARKTLYHQFGGKDGLTVAYLRARDQRWTAHWQEAITRQPDAMGRLLAIFDALETWRPSQDQPRGCAFADAFVELADASHPASQVVTEHWEAIESRLAALAEDAGLGSPTQVAADLLVVYRGVLTSMMLEPVQTAVGRGRALALGRLGHGVNPGSATRSAAEPAEA